MSRSLQLAAVLLVATPAAAIAQQPDLNVLVGAGLTSPTSAFSDVASSGYHAQLAVQVGIPTLPVSIRLNGDYHRLSAAGAAFDPSRVWGGALDVVFSLPGVGLTPYLLGGVGRYRVTSGPAGRGAARIFNGFNGGFGVSLGSLAFGGFVEIRYVQLQRSSDVRYIPVTVGIRL